MHLLLLACLLVLVGCTTVPPAAVPAPPSAAPATPAAPAKPAAAPGADLRAAMPAALAAERQWLQSWFEGTPVQIAQRHDGSLSIAVPREFSFDTGKVMVKPALAAVLRKVGESLRRVPLARVSVLAAPEDDHGTPPLAPLRAGQVQKQLLAAGVSAARLPKPTVSVGAAVQLQLRLEPAAP